MKTRLKRYVGIFLCFTMVTLCGCSNSSNDADSTKTPVVSEATATQSAAVSKISTQVLESWNDGENSMRQQIMDYVESVTDKNSSDFIPVEDRIAAFDMDGTVLCEKQYWVEIAVAKYRIEHDLSNDEELVEKLNQLLKDLTMDPEPEETTSLIEQVTGEAFEGMSEDDFVDYVADFMNKVPKEGHEDLLYVQTFYKPMLELISYLQANEFEVYLVSGSERGVVWGCVEGYNEKYPENAIDLDRTHMIGSDMLLVPAGNTDNDSDYIFQLDDELLRGSTITSKCLEMNKVLNIYRQIGKKPVFSGGNTDGDFSMVNFARSSDYKNMAVLIWHDDDRETIYNLNADWQEKAEKYGWELVSMKDEFKDIFIES